MYYKTIGEFLEKTRSTYNITLSKLCEGICSISTYARYEKDCFLPDKFTLDALLERLGKNPNTISYLLTNTDARCRELRVAIDDANMEEKRNLIEEYKDIRFKRTDKLHWQYMMMVKGDIEQEKGNKDRACECYKEAFCKTKEEKYLDSFHNNTLYSLIEFELLLHIFSIQEKGEEIEKMESFLSGLWDGHIVKKKFYAKVICELIAVSNIDRIDAVLYINKGLEYQRRIKQFVGMKDLLRRKKALSVLLQEEEALLGIEDDLSEIERVLANE